MTSTARDAGEPTEAAIRQLWDEYEYGIGVGAAVVPEERMAELDRLLAASVPTLLATIDRQRPLLAAALRWGNASINLRATAKRYGDATITSEQYWAEYSRAQDEVEESRQALDAAALALAGEAGAG